MLIIFYFIRLALTKRSLELQNIISRTNDALESAFSGVRIVKAFRAEPNQTEQFRKLLKERIGVELRFVMLWMGITNVYMWIQFAGQAIVLIVGGSMVIRDTLTVGDLYAFYQYMSLLAQPLLDIPQLFVSSRQAFACIDREIEVETTPGGTEEIYHGSSSIARVDTVSVNSASFSYDADLPNALDKIDISFHRGEKAAVVGAVGSGKTTLIKMVAGILPPTDGEILINDIPMNQYDMSEYRRRIGYIPQESTLFSETVVDNVKFGRDISDDTARDALDMAQVLEEMEAMPNGINEVLGQKGLTVSGGQKQRLAIARALAGNPDVLLMDDCTASLDAENERRFWAMFAEKFPDMSCLIVTHRLATARQADVIYVLAAGKIVGKGTHSELLRTCEEYQNFLSRDELAAALAPARSA
jgi:ATP-binding cassette subfamily B protein